MLRKLTLVGVAALVTACQSTTAQMPVTQTPDISNAKGQLVMKDTRPSGLGSLNWGRWNQDMPENSWAFNVTNADARSGTMSQRFELRNGDCTVMRIPGNSHPHDWGCNHDRERSEVMHTMWRPGADKWIGFSVKVDDDWSKSQRNHCTSIFQIKQHENNVYQGNKPGSKSGNYNQGHYIGGHPVMMGQICGGNFGVAIKWTGFEDNKFNGWEKTQNITMGSVSHIKGGWNDIVMRWDTSDYRNKNSVLEFYVNGQLAGKWENITSDFFPSNYVFKYGLYRSYMNQWGVTSKTQVIHFDEVRVGRSFDAVNPATNKAID